MRAHAMRPSGGSGLISLLILILFPLSAHSESPFLLQGIKDYDSGDYNSAIGHFGQAVSSDFDEPVLHYYMANTFVHLNQPESAIREFRIAYAEAPQGDMAKLCKLGLAYYGMDTTGSINKSVVPAKLPDKNAPRLDPTIEQALSVFRRKIEEAKISSSRQYQNQADAVSRQADWESQMIDRQTQQQIDDLKNNPVYARSAQMRQMMEQQLRDDAARRIDTLKKHYDLQRSMSVDTGAKSTSKIVESANNLEQLMGEKPHAGTPRLSPMGTNLYVRNYESTQDTAEKAAAKSSTKTTTTPQQIKP
jgi:tetratricopeptide (TPR) repeat protein